MKITIWKNGKIKDYAGLKKYIEKASRSSDAGFISHSERPGVGTNYKEMSSSCAHAMREYNKEYLARTKDLRRQAKQYVLQKAEITFADRVSEKYEDNTCKIELIGGGNFYHITLTNKVDRFPSWSRHYHQYLLTLDTKEKAYNHFNKLKEGGKQTLS